MVHVVVFLTFSSSALRVGAVLALLIEQAAEDACETRRATWKRRTRPRKRKKSKKLPGNRAKRAESMNAVSRSPGKEKVNSETIKRCEKINHGHDEKEY